MQVANSWRSAQFLSWTQKPSRSLPHLCWDSPKLQGPVEECVVCALCLADLEFLSLYIILWSISWNFFSDWFSICILEKNKAIDFLKVKKKKKARVFTWLIRWQDSDIHWSTFLYLDLMYLKSLNKEISSCFIRHLSLFLSYWGSLCLQSKSRALYFMWLIGITLAQQILFSLWVISPSKAQFGNERYR